MRYLSLIAIGMLFALGLGVGGMTQADKVITFLTLNESWDPSLAFVMIGGIATHWLLYRLILRREAPVFTERFGIPTRTNIDWRLIGGAGLFGTGWAITGFCPGPGLVSTATGALPALVFTTAMAAGMSLFHITDAILAEYQSDKLDHPAGDAQPATQVEIS